MHSRLILLAPAALVAAGPAAALDVATLQQAVARLLPGQELVPASVTLTDAQVDAIQQTPGVSMLSRRVRAWRTAAGDWLFMEQGHPHGSTLTYVVAIGADGSVKGVEILSYPVRYSEEMLEPRWLQQFTGKRHMALRWDLGVGTISGSTQSCETVASGVRRLLAVHALLAGARR